MWFLRVAEKRRFRSGVGQRVENREKMKISCTRSLSDDSTDSTDFWQFLTILDQKQPHTQIALPKIQRIDQKMTELNLINEIKFSMKFSHARE